MPFASVVLGKLFGRWWSGRPKRPATPAAPQVVRFGGPGRAPAAVVAGEPGAPSSDWTYPPLPVSSSNLAAVAYDRDTLTLEVAFQDKDRGGIGSVYRYAGVPLAVYLGLMGAPSKGRYLHENVKTPAGKYPYRRVS